MRQVAQRPRDGSIVIQEVATPHLRPGWVLVRNRCSLISAGTERSKIELGSKSLVQKARARPDLAKKVVDRARVEGVRTALSVARDRLDALSPIGYSSAGDVVRVGPNVVGLAPGDAVACGGADWANHADVVAVPRNLVARIPNGVDYADAAYATVGAIALHAVRQSGATVGERVGVIGLGLVGQLAVQILRAAGCEPVGIDQDLVPVERLRADGVLAFRRDAAGLEASIHEIAGGTGLDAVLVCAATSSSDPVVLGAELARDRGTVVVVGQVPISVDWKLAYEKELQIRLSRSYGPGRYDRDYEEYGHDLPVGYVRWTEQRNLEAFLALVASGRVTPSVLTTHRFDVSDAADAYAAITASSGERAFGVVLDYGEPTEARRSPTPVSTVRRARTATSARIGLIGAGAFARGTLLPALQAAGATLASVASERGLSASDTAERFGFEGSANSAEELIADASIDAVVIATRHSTHAGLVTQALESGKGVFVEKPLALTRDELDRIEELAQGQVLVVGFNRRFAPMSLQLRETLRGIPGRVIHARVNAGPLPPEHWMHDIREGGGRLLGEGCHFVDLLGFLAGVEIREVHCYAVAQPQRPLEASDALTASFRFADESVASLVYVGNGDARLAKERIEAFGGGVSAVLDDFRRLEIFSQGRKHTTKSAQDKGHRAQMAMFVGALRGDAAAPPAASYIASMRATLALVDSLESGEPVTV